MAPWCNLDLWPTSKSNFVLQAEDQNPLNLLVLLMITFSIESLLWYLLSRYIWREPWCRGPSRCGGLRSRASGGIPRKLPKLRRFWLLWAGVRGGKLPTADFKLFPVWQSVLWRILSTGTRKLYEELDFYRWYPCYASKWPGNDHNKKYVCVQYLLLGRLVSTVECSTIS